MPSVTGTYRMGPGGFFSDTDGSGPYSINSAGVATLITQVSVAQVGVAASSVTSVTSAAANTTLLAANAARRGATIFNESTSVLYLKLGSASSITSYTVIIAANGYYEVPFGYTGAITGLWASANGAARVTEVS
ncbi:hypothetical protein OKW98_18465 [Pseudomonas sp. KU26590]|uniref:hypothetical protein n=1 Tax=Pseudomonas sp. KU26590 TaxID=2991051 RepID=UPI00223D9E1E|nr:hypothetical protein [Pseudomonas sp. KU26590]UZJ58562.1 hypothetical protein OKW98_18465 [Pseudomonas sp. KU26590]